MVTIALIGAGKIARLHAANIRANPDAHLAWICDPRPGNAARLAADGERVTLDAHEAIASPGTDAIWVTSPNATHVDWILAGVKAGKPVFCEKPVDLDLDRARDCERQVAELGGRVMIGFNRRFDPTFAELQARVADGEIGQVIQATITARDPEPPPLAYVPTSGGIFRDMSIHDFDVARWLAGPIESVYAIGQDTDEGLREAGDLGAATVLLRAASGATVTVFSSRSCAFGYDQRVEVFGTDGMLQARNERPTRVAGYKPTTTATLGRLKDHYIQRFAQAYQRELAAFIVGVQSGGPLAPGLAQGVAALEIADAAARSAATGTVVRLPGN
jgi:myo-inositol 2-dehydrogenase/D-chiro-inositol 1-dehydrogenase